MFFKDSMFGHTSNIFYMFGYELVDFHTHILGNQGASARRIRGIAEVEVYPLQKFVFKILCFAHTSNHN